MRELSGTPLKLAILRSTFLPDHPEPFRRQAVVLALHADKVTAKATNVDNALLSLLRQGYLVRTEEQEQAFQPFHLWMFARPDRTSDRPGYRPGERSDLWHEPRL